MSRRDTLMTTLGTMAALATAATLSSRTPEKAAYSAIGVETLPTIDDAIRVIDASCDRTFLHAVVASDYRFLYRGVDPALAGISPSPTVRTEPCDLLDPSTYGSEEAAKYFSRLDDAMQRRGSPVLPRNGHLATTSAEEAARWGQAASVWPLGEGAHFAWYADGGTFWPDHRNDGAGAADVIVDGVDCGRMNLVDALEGESCEILFHANRFLTVPASMEEDLREKLRNSFII